MLDMIHSCVYSALTMNNTTNTETEMMRLAVVHDANVASNWAEVHKSGCQHLGRNKPVSHEVEAADRVSAIREIGSDLLSDGNSLEEVTGYIDFAPCLKVFK